MLSENASKEEVKQYIKDRSCVKEVRINNDKYVGRPAIEPFESQFYNNFVQFISLNHPHFGNNKLELWAGKRKSDNGTIEDKVFHAYSLNGTRQVVGEKYTGDDRRLIDIIFYRGRVFEINPILLNMLMRNPIRVKYKDNKIETEKADIKSLYASIRKMSEKNGAFIHADAEGRSLEYNCTLCGKLSSSIAFNKLPEKERYGEPSKESDAIFDEENKICTYLEQNNDFFMIRNFTNGDDMIVMAKSFQCAGQEAMVIPLIKEGILDFFEMPNAKFVLDPTGSRYGEDVTYFPNTSARHIENYQSLSRLTAQLKNPKSRRYVFDNSVVYKKGFFRRLFDNLKSGSEKQRQQIHIYTTQGCGWLYI